MGFRSKAVSKSYLSNIFSSILPVLTIMSLNTFAYSQCQTDSVPEAKNTLKFNGNGQVKLHYEIHGAGKPVIFLHGFGASTYSWRHLIPSLKTHFKLIMIDLKGFGQSPKPNDNNYSAHDQANLICQFIIQEDLRNVTLVGHSYGGGVA